MKEERLPRSFFSRPTLTVARDLIGRRLVHIQEGEQLAGIVTECEAYVGEEDLACHARSGRTARNAVMYGRPGFAYVYFTYGMHWLFNVVTEPEDRPAAVLIRAVQPTAGRETIALRRAGRPEKIWADGPGKLTVAFGIGQQNNGQDLCSADSLFFFTSGQGADARPVTTTPRRGLNNVPEPWFSLPWRFVTNG